MKMENMSDSVFAVYDNGGRALAYFGNEEEAKRFIPTSPASLDFSRRFFSNLQPRNPFELFMFQESFRFSYGHVKENL